MPHADSEHVVSAGTANRSEHRTRGGWVEHLYFKRFGKRRPNVVVSIEERARMEQDRKASTWTDDVIQYAEASRGRNDSPIAIARVGEETFGERFVTRILGRGVGLGRLLPEARLPCAILR